MVPLCGSCYEELLSLPPEVRMARVADILRAMDIHIVATRLEELLERLRDIAHLPSRYDLN
jgi:hypothetical protein